MRLLGRGLTRKEGVTWRCPRGCPLRGCSAPTSLQVAAQPHCALPRLRWAGGGGRFGPLLIPRVLL